MIRKPNFKLNWKYALGELVLIFLGISLAITFQNWNEERKRATSEVAYLEQLLEDLVRDSTTVDRYVLLAGWKYDDGKYVEKYLKNELTDLDSALLLTNLFMNGRNVQYRPYLPTYDELISSGNLSVIQNDKIRTGLRELMNRRVKDEGFYIEEFHARKVSYNNHVFKHFSAELMSALWNANTVDQRRKVFELKDFADYRMDFDSFKKDKASLYHVEVCLGVDRENIANQRYNLRRVSNILEFVRSEIKKKSD